MLSSNGFNRVLALTTIVASTMITSAASATSLAPELQNAKRAQIDSVEMDPKIKAKYNGGHVEMNDREVVVMLQRAWSCPPGAMCAMVMPAPEFFRAKIVDRSKSCGSDIVVARRDLRIADGGLLEITVADHTNRLCRDLRKGTVEVELSQTSPRSGIRHDSLLISRDGFKSKDGSDDAKSVKIDTVELDNTYRTEIFGSAFRADEAFVAKKKGYLELKIVPHTIYCAAVVGMNCPNPQTHVAALKISSERKVDCGSTEIQAQGHIRMANGKTAPAYITVLDHSSRVCDDYRPYQTEVTYSIYTGHRRNPTQRLLAKKSLLLQR